VVHEIECGNECVAGLARPRHASTLPRNYWRGAT
jgi:hypothetical protein